MESIHIPATTIAEDNALAEQDKESGLVDESSGASIDDNSGGFDDNRAQLAYPPDAQTQAIIRDIVVSGLWSLLATNTLAAPAPTLDTGTFPVAKYLRIEISYPDSAVVTQPAIKFNNSQNADGSRYAYTFQQTVNAAVAAADARNEDEILIRSNGSITAGCWATIEIYNDNSVVTTYPVIIHSLSFPDDIAANEPWAFFTVGEADLATNPITSVQLLEMAGPDNNFPTGTRINVFGHN